MVRFKYEKVTFNNRSGWFATKYLGNIYIGTMFGVTKAKARAAFDNTVD